MLHELNAEIEFHHERSTRNATACEAAIQAADLISVMDSDQLKQMVCRALYRWPLCNGATGIAASGALAAALIQAHMEFTENQRRRNHGCATRAEALPVSPDRHVRSQTPQRSTTPRPPACSALRPKTSRTSFVPGRSAETTTERMSCQSPRTSRSVGASDDAAKGTGKGDAQ